ncbi:2-hydroxyacid dehydrogenase [Aureivirga marina]|uniref:2-hydroxyacid dehydrogenase n=1 Tax=Aureivirga marina TaxID=1182451 RepID=UPI001E5266DF|nr:2-hydroxyacid dehydrogenase [Aureivirga marina]
MSKKIKITVFNSKQWVVDSFSKINQKFHFELDFQETRLYSKTALLANGSDAVCVFVNDDVNAEVIEKLHDLDVKLIALRCAGFNNVSIEKAKEIGMEVVRVPAYSPFAVAEHTLGLILSLNRKFHKAYNRVREGNFALDGLLGFDIHGKTIGVIGAGKIGQTFIKMMSGFGCEILIYDMYENQEMKDLGAKHVSLNTLYQKSDIISLHCPLTKETFHMIDEQAIEKMKDKVMIINTSRGKLIDTDAVIKGLKSNKIGYLGLDVYEEEEALFFEDLSETIIQDDQFVRLQTFPNVLITAHQAFFTKEAVTNIAETTFENIHDYFIEGKVENSVIIE